MVGQRNLKPVGAAKFASSGFLLSASLEKLRVWNLGHTTADIFVV
jgi:hypothetical protein